MNACKNAVIVLSMLAAAGHAGYQENQAWMFESGNLVSNWSFENLSDEICGQAQPGTGGTTTDCRAKSGDARTGNYLLAVQARNEGVPDIPNQTNLFAVSQTSKTFRVEPGATYTFSVQIRIQWSERIANSRPVVCWMKEDKSFISCAEGDTYLARFPADIAVWTPYSFDFTLPSEAQYIYFHLVESNNDGVTGQAGDSYFFDDLVIRKAGAPAGILELRAYGNAAGRIDHTILNDGTSDVVSKLDFDGLGRPHRAYLPISRSGLLSDAVIISTLNLGTELQVDFQDVQSAYAAVSAQALSAPIASLPLSYAFYAIVASEGDLAPVSAALAEITAMLSSDGVHLDLELIGVVRGSPEYAYLVESQAGTPPSHASKGPFAGDFEGMLAAQYPDEDNLFSESTYPNPGVTTIHTASLPGNDYGPSTRTGRRGNAMLAANTIPSDPEYQSDPGDLEARFHYSWSRDPQGIYSARILDERGLVVKTATSRIPNPTSEADWIISESGYNDLAQLTTSITPDGLATTYAYNGRGLLASYTDPDRGTCDHLYDDRGHLRFKRTELGMNTGHFIAIQYDALGRQVGRGKVTVAGDFTQANADNAGYPGVGELYQGMIYDELDPVTFEEATGTTLASLGFSPSLRNGHGRVVVSYNRNPESSAPGISGPVRKLVATFNSFDELGRLAERWKYIGPAPAGKRWHKLKYSYDTDDRVKTMTVFRDETEGEIVSKAEVIYDSRGRVNQVLDKNQGVLAQYTYDFQGRTTSVGLPGSMRVAYTYDIQGKPVGLSSTANAGSKLLFQELLGYEGKAHPDVTNAVAEPRFDRNISSLIRKFPDGAGDPVEFWQYEYDGSNMVGASKHTPIAGGGVDPVNGSINFPVTFNSNPSAVRDYGYNDDGSITNQSDGQVAHEYVYPEGSHLLDRVTPSLPGRNTAAEGNFQYDAIGRMTEDRGAQRELTYGFADRPVKIEVSGVPMHFYYDENEYQVAALEETHPGVILAQTMQVYETGLKVVKELVQREAGHPHGAFEVVKFQEYGQGGMVSVGYSGENYTHVLLKDHQGSVMGAVATSTGGIALGQGYLPYGGIEPRVGTGNDLVPSEGYTGKFFNASLGLYNFGARFYDPGLGIWLTPDPARQFFNPYTFGGDPVNFVDPDGEFIIEAIIIGAVVGAYLGGSAANSSFNPVDWDYTSGDTYLGMGVGAVVGGAAGAGLAGGIALGGTLGAGVTGAGVGGLAGLGLETRSQVLSGNFSAGRLLGASVAGGAAGFAAGATGSWAWNGVGATTIAGKAAAGWLSGLWGWTAGTSTWNYGMGVVEGANPLSSLLAVPDDLYGNLRGYASTTLSLATFQETHLGIEGSSIIYSNKVEDAWMEWQFEGEGVPLATTKGHTINLRTDAGKYRPVGQIIRHERRHVQQFTHTGLNIRYPSGRRVPTGYGIFNSYNATHIREFEEDAYEYEKKGEYPNPFWFY